MALYVTPEEHADNPPETWEVVKVRRKWALRDSLGSTLETHERKRDAEQAREDGLCARLWELERRWYAGEPVNGWRTYAQCLADRRRAAAERAAVGR